MPRAKTWFAEVPAPDAQTLLQNQVEFLKKFMAALFTSFDAGQLVGATSLHFHRIAHEVRFRVISSSGITPALIIEIDQRLAAAQTVGLIKGFRCEAEGEWETPDPRYGTDVPAVGPAFTNFMESVSRA